MPAKNDGGAAFPTEPRGPIHGNRYDGMTLRDWFAGNAPVTVFEAAASCGYQDLFEAMNVKTQRITVFNALVAMRFEYADAMLEARK